MGKNSGGVDAIAANLDNYAAPLNKAINQLTDLIRDFRDVDISGTGNYTLSVEDATPEGRVPVIRLTGTLTGARNVLLPVTGGGRFFIVFNETNGAFTLTVKTTAGTSTGVSIDSGFIQFLWHNGTHVYAAAVPVSTSGTQRSGMVYTPELNVIAATALTASAFGRMHVIFDSGTPADFTVTLPTPTSADIGKVIEFRVDNSATKLYTLDAGAGRTIDGQQTRVLWANETVRLVCVYTSGVAWVKVGGKSIPMVGQLHLGADQSLASGGGTATQINVNTTDVNQGGIVESASFRLRIRRAGIYNVYGQGYMGPTAVTRCTVNVNKNGVQLIAGEESTAAAGSYAVPQCDGRESLAAGDLLTLAMYQDAGGSRTVLGHATTRYTFLGCEEVPSW